MTSQTLVDSRTQAEFYKPESLEDVINPSRAITLEDETYLRDYTLAAAILSWDEVTYGTPFQVVPDDITNIAIAGDIVWYQINYHRAIPLHIEVFHAHRQQIELHKMQLEKAQTASRSQPQLDVPSSTRNHQMQTLPAQLPQQQEGNCNHQEAVAALGRALVEQTHSLNRHLISPALPPQVKQTEWSVIYDSERNSYNAWVGRKWAGRATTLEAAERLAQHYLALAPTMRPQEQAILAA